MKKLIIVLCVFWFMQGVAQDNAFSLGFLKTELKNNAVRFAVDYAEELEPRMELFKTGSNHLLSFTPDVEVLLGSDDAFNGIVAKYTGNIMVFRTTEVAGIEGVPDLSGYFSNFPVSLGFESNQKLSFMSGLIEAGYVPWYQNISSLNKAIRSTKVGVFLQGGYKFKTTSDTIPASIGEENVEDALFRAKLSAGFQPEFILSRESGMGFGIGGFGDLWYDFLNSEIYYRVVADIRIMLSKEMAFEFKYERGSGAPNFNQGDQFSANLLLVF